MWTISKPILKGSKETIIMEDIGSENEAYFWRVSSTVLSKVEGAGYLENKRKHNEYLSSRKEVSYQYEAL